jgi:hypothetical protein
MSLKLDFVLTSEVAFFDESVRISIIQVLEIFRIKKSTDANKPVSLGKFAISGRVSGNYGDGIILKVFSESGNVLIKETPIKARQLNKPYFTFIADVRGVVVSEVGDYFITITGISGEKVVEKQKLFSVEAI